VVLPSVWCIVAAELIHRFIVIVAYSVYMWYLYVFRWLHFLEYFYDFKNVYEGVFRSFQTGHLERELQMVQFSATKCSCIAIPWVSLVSFTAIALCVASQWIIPKVSLHFVMTQSGNFWIHVFFFLFNCQSMLCGPLSPRYRGSSGCGCRRRPPDVEGSCGCFE
jgi:hypothetical protein